MVFHMGRVAGKCLVTLMSNYSFPHTVECFFHLCHLASFSQVGCSDPDWL